MQHTVVETPVTEKQEAGFRAEADGCVGWGTCMGGYRVRGEAAGDFATACIGELRWIETTNFILEELPYARASGVGPREVCGVEGCVVVGERKASRGAPVEFHAADADDGEPEEIIVFTA